MKELCTKAFGPKSRGMGAVGITPVLCLERFPLWRETPEEGVEKSDFSLMGSGSHGWGTGGDRKGSDALLVEGGNKALCDRRGGVSIL